jgi:hypothetical protein
MSYIPFDKNTSYALVIGVGNRDEEETDTMAISAEDARHLSEALVEFDLFKEENIETLVNAGAVKPALNAKLTDLIEKTRHKPADLVIIYFSGHGYKKDDTYYLICNDTRSNALNKTALKGSDFAASLQSIQCNKMLVLLDCCHAAGITANEKDEDIPFEPTELLKQKNKIILTACEKNQVSYLSRPVSIFTYALIEGLGGKLLGDGYTEVNIFNLAMDVRERVVALSGAEGLKIDPPQRPQLNVLKGSGTTDFTIVNYPKGGRKEILLFEQPFSALKTADGKEFLNLQAERIPDINYRNEISNKIIITNNYNNIIQTGNGNFVVGGLVINNGLSENVLKEVIDTVIKANRDIYELFIGLLKQQNEPASRELLVKTKKNQLTTSIAEIVDAAKKKLIGTLIRKRMLLLDEIETEAGKTLITLKMALEENTTRLKAYGIDVDDIGFPDLKSLNL